MVGSSLFVFHLRKLMYIFQEMVDTETEYVKSLQYIMDVSMIFSILIFLFFFFWLFDSFLTTIFLFYVFCFFFTCRITWQRWTTPSYYLRSEARRIFSSGISKESTIFTNGKSRNSSPVLGDFAPERNFRYGAIIGVNSRRCKSPQHDIFWGYHVNKYRAKRGNRSELASVRAKGAPVSCKRP